MLQNPKDFAPCHVENWHVKFTGRMFLNIHETIVTGVGSFSSLTASGPNDQERYFAFFSHFLN
jgi:hypothetical protein